jgi:ABC-type dipeptide/oligopeptide/nickel transport system ATPase component
MVAELRDLAPELPVPDDSGSGARPDAVAHHVPDDLAEHRRTTAGAFQPVRDVSLRLGQDETLAIVGECGSVKSLTGLSITGLLPPAIEISFGSIWTARVEIVGLDEERLEGLRGRVAVMIFQDPMSSLNTIMRVGDQIADGLLIHGSAARAQRVGQVAACLFG